MISATALLATPSTVSCPTEFELITVCVVLLGKAHPGDTTYQSGSFSASTSLSRPSGRHRSRPIAGSVQTPDATPSLLVPKFPGASGQGRRPGSSSVVVAAWRAGQPMSACFAWLRTLPLYSRSTPTNALAALNLLTTR